MVKVTDYIIEKLIENGVSDVFGYPGGVITHFMDSGKKYEPKIKLHTLYHEQAAAFAACAYSQANHSTGCVYATSGPGATNLITGIANAWYDSIPVLFFTGNVDTYGMKLNPLMRQRGFQETEISEIVKNITKYSICVKDAVEIPEILNKAIMIANEGRKGPVLIDLPADVQRAEIEPKVIKNSNVLDCEKKNFSIIERLLNQSKKPLFLLGAGIKQTSNTEKTISFAKKNNIPFVESLPCFDIAEYDCSLNMGWIGANGKRYSNILLDKCDLLITIGTRLDLKQVGNIRNKFALKARLIRIDCDEAEFSLKVKDNEIQIKADITDVINYLSTVKIKSDYSDWVNICQNVKAKLENEDLRDFHYKIRSLAKIYNDSNITIDVGQSMLWVAQGVQLIGDQHVFMSSGLGSMGYSLPAAIGVYYATHKTVLAFCGDGGLQMNIQEMEFIAKEHLPIAIVLLNNSALGMIRQFQENNFNKDYVHTTLTSGYANPQFEKLANAYGFDYKCISDNLTDFSEIKEISKPTFLEINIKGNTYLTPNWGEKEALYSDMKPLLDRSCFDYLMRL